MTRAPATYGAARQDLGAASHELFTQVDPGISSVVPGSWRGGPLGAGWMLNHHCRPSRIALLSPLSTFMHSNTFGRVTSQMARAGPRTKPDLLSPSFGNSFMRRPRNPHSSGPRLRVAGSSWLPLRARKVRTARANPDGNQRLSVAS